MRILGVRNPSLKCVSPRASYGGLRGEEPCRPTAVVALDDMMVRMSARRFERDGGLELGKCYGYGGRPQRPCATDGAMGTDTSYVCIGTPDARDADLLEDILWSEGVFEAYGIVRWGTAILWLQFGLGVPGFTMSPGGVRRCRADGAPCSSSRGLSSSCRSVRGFGLSIGFVLQGVALSRWTLVALCTPMRSSRQFNAG